MSLFTSIKSLCFHFSLLCVVSIFVVSAGCLDESSHWNERGVELTELGNYDAAIIAFDKALELNPKNPYAYKNRGDTLFEIGKYTDAVKSYDNALAIYPQYPEAWNERGRSLIEIHRYGDAIKSFENALDVDLNYHSAWYGMGYALNRIGRYDDAIESYDKYLTVYPRSYGAWNNRGVSLENLKMYNDALASYDRAIEIDPYYTLAINNKARIEKTLGSSSISKNTPTPTPTPAPVYPPPTSLSDILSFNDVFVYKDYREINDISIRLRNIEYANRIDTLTPQSGYTYLLVSIQVTHRGSRSENSWEQTIVSPSRHSFRLHGMGQSFSPISTSSITSYGEMYDQVNLYRGENKQGWIVFSIPQRILSSDLYLKVELSKPYGDVYWKLK